MKVIRYLKELPWPNLMARFLIANDLLLLPGALLQKDTTLLVYCLMRILLYISAEVLNVVRRSRRYYIPGLQEITEDGYWYSVSFVLFAVKLFFMNIFVVFPPTFRLLELYLAISILLRIVMKYQSQTWFAEEKERREKRIAHLVRKADLTENEYQTVRPVLLNVAREYQRQPYSLRFLLTSISLIIGMLLSVYASDIADWLEKIQLLPRILPPN